MTKSPAKNSAQNIIPNWLILSISTLAFIGFLDASYLTIKHFTGGIVNCTLTEGCDIVTTSQYSEIFGIPVALLGLFYYLTVLITSLLYFDTKNYKIISFLPIMATAGILFSGWFVYAQIFLIKAICQYCVLSAITSTLIFILSMFILIHKKKNP